MKKGTLIRTMLLLSEWYPSLREVTAHAILVSVVVFVLLPVALVLNGHFVPTYVVANGGKKAAQLKEDTPGECNILYFKRTNDGGQNLRVPMKFQPSQPEKSE